MSDWLGLTHAPRAPLQAEYCDDTAGAVEALLRGKCWREAVRLCLRRGEGAGDLLGDVVAPTLTAAAHTARGRIADARAALGSAVERLAACRRLRARMAAEGAAGDAPVGAEDDAPLDDSASVWSDASSVTGSVYSAYSAASASSAASGASYKTEGTY